MVVGMPVIIVFFFEPLVVVLYPMMVVLPMNQNSRFVWDLDSPAVVLFCMQVIL